MAQGFYYGMGSIVLDLTSLPKLAKKAKMDRLVMPSKGLCQALEEGSSMLPYVSDEDIMDKSKANSLIKAIACIQALWFCLQFITRLAQSLPVSLLELNTFAHALCALLIFYLWWHKPHDVDQPSLIQPNFEQEQLSEDVRRIVRHSTEFYLFEQTSSGSSEWESVWLHPHEFLTINPHHFDESCTTKRVLRRAYPCGSEKTYQANEEIELETGSTFFVHPSVASLSINSAFLEDVPKVYMSIDLLIKRATNIPSLSDLNLDALLAGVGHDWTGRLALVISGLFYGGFHGLAWSSNTIHTGPELLIWKISCISILVYGPIILLGAIRWRLDDSLPHSLDALTFYLNLLLAVLSTLLYVFARFFLVIEVFLNIPYMDAAVFDTPNWTAYWPHIG